MPIRIIKPTLIFGNMTDLPKAAVRHLVIHTQGAPSNEDGSVEEIHAYHRRPVAQHGRGWAGIGYHFVIRKSGIVQQGRPLNYQGAHVHGYNGASIGVCCSGNGDLSDFTIAQKNSLRDLMRDLRREFAGAMVHGHRALVDELIGSGQLAARFRTTKTCPGTRVNLLELQQSIELEPMKPQPGERRWSHHLKDWVVLRQYVSDSEWYFVTPAQPSRSVTLAAARWTEMPLGPG